MSRSVKVPASVAEVLGLEHKGGEPRSAVRAYKKGPKKMPRWRKGQRIVVNTGKIKDPEFYLGTVTGRRGDKVYVETDNGEKVTVKEKSPRIVGVGVEDKKKGKIGWAKLKKWVEQFNPKSAAYKKFAK